MLKLRSKTKYVTMTLAAIAAAFCLTTAMGQEPQKKKRVEKGQPRERGVEDKRQEDRRVERRTERTPQRPSYRGAPWERIVHKQDRAPVAYLPTRREYGHVRVVEHPRRDDNRWDARTLIVRSAAVRPTVVLRFEDRQKAQLKRVVEYFRGGSSAAALELWAEFVVGLGEYREPVDLDEIMLHVARESCFRENDAALFYAQKLAFIRDSQERLEDYVAQLYEQRAYSTRRSGVLSSDALQRLQTELVRAKADLEILGIEESVASAEFEANTLANRDYEARFTSVYSGLYLEVERRIRLSSTRTEYRRP